MYIIFDKKNMRCATDIVFENKKDADLWLVNNGNIGFVVKLQIARLLLEQD